MLGKRSNAARRHVAQVFSTALLAVVLASAAQGAEQNGSRARMVELAKNPKLRRAWKLEEQLASQDTLSVIVNVKEPENELGEDAPNPQRMIQRRRDIAGRCERVYSKFTRPDVRVGLQLTNQATFSAEVTVGALAELLVDPDVESVEPNELLEPHGRQALPLMNAWLTRDNNRGAGVSVAICDTGIDTRHPALGGGGFPNAKVIGGYDFGMDDPDPRPSGKAHGTACAGIAAGDEIYSGDYVGGVAPDARIYALKISRDSDHRAELIAIAAAWDWCVTHQFDDPSNPIMVISTSFGGGRYFGACDESATSTARAAREAAAHGITILASSGNDGFCDSMGHPACISDVIAVGAVYDSAFGSNPRSGFVGCVAEEACAAYSVNCPCDSGGCYVDRTSADRVTSYSNSASFLDILAPSNNAYTTDIIGEGGYSPNEYADAFGGTSAACPYAAGAVAVIQSAAFASSGRFLSPSEVRSLLVESGDPITDDKSGFTKPRVNLGDALARLQSGSEDEDDRFEENDFREEAAMINTGHYAGLQGIDDDWFLLDLVNPGSLIVRIDGSRGDLDLYLIDERGRDLGASTSETSREEVFIDNAPKTVLILVTPYEQRNSSYVLMIDAAQDTQECESDSMCDVNATCTNTPDGFTCNCDAGYSGDGFACTAICGDGLVVAPEQCDDNNTIDGDCCSATCQFEAAGNVCPEDGNVCTDNVCDGVGNCGVDNTAPCDDLTFCNGTELCLAGKCVAGTPPCTVEEFCDEDLDVCRPPEPDPSTEMCGTGVVEALALSMIGLLGFASFRTRPAQSLESSYEEVYNG